MNEEKIDTQATYFNNTIRWHIGHALVVTEKFLFQYPKKTTHIPEHYAAMFSSGTKPADWTEKAPSLEVLMEQLSEQQNRVNDFNDLFWKTNVPFKVPFGSIETYSDLLIMLAYHEAEHLGKIKAMYQVVNA